MVPILGAVLPILIHLAEGIFTGDGKGADKKAFVMDILGQIFDRLSGAGKIPPWLPKDLTMEILSFTIDKTVPQLFK